MKAVVLTGIRTLETIEVDVPEIKNKNEVLIKVKSVGVCGSDIHYFSDGKIGSQIVKFPFSIGHECSGVVVETGEAVTCVKPGDLVAIDPSVHCGHCDQCLSGRPHTCRANLFLGCPGQLDGCLAEYIVMPDFCCFPVDDKFDPTLATLVEPLSIGTYSVGLAGNDFSGRTVGIFGTGPIGLSVLMVLKHRNSPDRVFCFEPLEYRRKKASELGADYVFDPFLSAVSPLVSTIEPNLLDFVFECSGSQKAIDDATALLKPGGKLILTGIPPEGRYTFNMDLMRRKEITIINVRRQNHCVEKSIELIGNGLPVELMVSHHFYPEEVQKAFDIVANYNAGAIKVMIDFL